MSNTGAESVAPYTLYSGATPNGIKISITLEELGAAFETLVDGLFLSRLSDLYYSQCLRG
jgi:hypothetical protein